MRNGCVLKMGLKVTDGSMDLKTSVHFGPEAVLIYLGVNELDRLHVVTETLSQPLLVPELRGDSCKL